MYFYVNLQNKENDACCMTKGFADCLNKGNSKNTERSYFSLKNCKKLRKDENKRVDDSKINLLES